MDKKGLKKKSKSTVEKINKKDRASKITDDVSKSRGSKGTAIENPTKVQSRTDESIRDSLNILSSVHEPTYWPEEGLHTESNIRISRELSRTSFLLQDYREFKAARTIQRFFRGWFVRRMLEKKKRAVLVIQTIWRGFCARRFYYRKLEAIVQKRIMEYYYRSAQKIQAFWRGFWIRQNIHDQYRKKRMQMRAAEDLLHCVAFKLHHLLRTHQIPGIYSLRNSNCLSKVEQLLYAMQFKQFNDRVRKLRVQRENMIQIAKNTHKESAYMTELPYSGPNFQGICEPKCCELYKDIDADAKMFKILSLYERAARVDTRLKRMKSRKKSQQRHQGRHKIKYGDFCGDVIKSMKKWKILGSNEVKIKNDVFNCPENVEKFLTEMQSMNNILQPRCHCRINIDTLLSAA